MKYCVKCKYCRKYTESLSYGGPIVDYGCFNDVSNISPVTGKPIEISCINAREDYGFCKKEGLYFEPTQS